MRRTLTVVGASLVVAGALAAPVAAVDRFGASLNPVPLIVENWGPEPAVLVTNLGTIPVHVSLELSGDDAYRLAPIPTEPLGPGDTLSAAVTGIGDGQATVTATITNDLPGIDRPTIVLQGTIRHATLLEANPWAVPVALALAIAFGLLCLALIRRRFHR